MEKDINKKKNVFWEQFPKGTEQFAFSIEESIMDTMYEAEKELNPLVEILSAIGIAVGHILQTSCQLHDYDGEKQIKSLLYDALQKSYDFYKTNLTWFDKGLGRDKSTADNE